MRALLVLAGVAGLMLGGVSGLLPTLALEAGHGDGRQLAAGAGFENCTNAAKADWETCRTAVKAAFTGNDTTTCGGYDKVEAEFKCDVDFIFNCADLRIVENDRRKTAISQPDMCSSVNMRYFGDAPTACPLKTYPSITAVVGKACEGVPTSSPTTPKPTFRFQASPSPTSPTTTTPSPTLSSEEAACMTFVAGCLRPYLIEVSGLSPSNLARPEKLSKLKTDDVCYFDGSWRESYFECLNTGPPSCAATIATECSTIYTHSVEASEKACKERYPSGYPEVRSGCIKSDWENPFYILGIVVGVLLFVVVPVGIKYYVRRTKTEASYEAGKDLGKVAVAVLSPQD
jgi:hypothetical protein